MFNFQFLLASGGTQWLTIAMIALLVIFFIFMSRSQKKRDRADQEMRDSLQVGDEVTTIGGIIGKVVSIKAETFVLETTKDKTKIRFLKGAIRSVDVKAADIAAAIIEANNEKAAEAEANTEVISDNDAEDTKKQ